ncbi:MAG TPA: transglutaminaseTgpA domain-containing protein, partial [Negativicutes bacterium]|nr:transglutaminaseTgpA domain-containing protein [Negativicutes bacterium]
MKNRNIKELLFYFSIVFIMLFSFNLALADSAGMETGVYGLAAFTFAVTLIIFAVAVYPLSATAMVIAGLGFLLYRFSMDQNILAEFIKDIRDFYNWLYWYIPGNNPFRQSYSLMFLIFNDLIALLVIIPVILTGRGSFFLALLGASVFWAFWLIYVESARKYLMFFLLAAIMLYSYQTYRKRLKEWKAAGGQVEKDVGGNWIRLSALAVSAALLISLALPLKIEPLRWPWLNDNIVRLFPFVSDLRNDSMESFSYGFNSRFSLNSAGYVNRRLGGDMKTDDAILMTVRTRSKDTLYLRGTVKERYLGSCWYKSERKYNQYSPGEAMALPFGEDVRTIERTFDIKYEDLLTSTIFAPYSVYKVIHESISIFSDEDSEVYASKMTMKDGTYSVISRIPYIDEQSLRMARTDNMDTKDLKEYTSVDPSITIRVRDLASDITGSYTNNYDKAKAIEEYLRKNYKYNKKPHAIPQKAEFTDYFLFESREGYCTYFATAMSVLLREAGIPCRYVEGFISRYEGRDSRIIRGADAHAWVEVYFDDYGWVTFEPTPYYPEVERVEAPAAATAAVPVKTNDAAASEKKNRISTLRTRGIHDLDVEVSEDSVEEGLEGPDWVKRTALVVNIAALLAIFVTLLRFIFGFAKVKIREARVR